MVNEWQQSKAFRAQPVLTFRSISSLLLQPSTSNRHDQIGLVARMRFGLVVMLTLLLCSISSCSIVESRPFDASTSKVGEGRGNVGNIDRQGPVLMERDEDSPTSVCTRWSHQSAVVNGTMFIFGGRSSTEPGQRSGTWNNHFLTMDLTDDWQISSPSLTGLPQPSFLPPVSNGYLWHSYESLFLYGGEFSDTPAALPVPFSLWEYRISSSEWIEHADPRTSTGLNAEADSVPVQRSAEGAGANSATLGRGWYFGGHLDGYTTPGWSQSIPRVYLKSLIEFTFPGYSNEAVDSLASGIEADEAGVWRNITEGGLQDEAGFTQRADGLIVYIPGFGDDGILLGLAGGTNATFTQMNVIDVYDIATSTWYKQATSGRTPDIRVNPCATVAAAPDGTSYNIYMFGGQNLIPYGSQTQYDDMWILSVPSFTWIQVDMESQAVPPARAGHTCNIWDGQMIVVGGYVGQDLSCDSPGIYVFNMTSLEWKNEFKALSRGERGLTDDDDESLFNPLSQHPSQRGPDVLQGLEGSYGYRVPEPVISVIGGSPTGGATVTAPIQTATGGPLATGKLVTYTVTGADGAIVTQVSQADPRDDDSKGRNIGVIVAGTFAGVLLLVAIYFGFCAWVYRKQLELYKNHLAMAQRASTSRGEKDAIAVPPPSQNSSDRRPGERKESSEHSAIGASGVTGRNGRQGMNGDHSYQSVDRRGSAISDSDDDLLAGQEPTFWGARGVLLNPRRSLRVINRD